MTTTLVILVLQQKTNITCLDLQNTMANAKLPLLCGLEQCILMGDNSRFTKHNNCLYNNANSWTFYVLLSACQNLKI